MTSDRQVNRDGEAVLLLVAQADGNVQRHHQFAGPSASSTAYRPRPTSFGGNIELRDYQGFDLYAEYDLSVSYRKYPNVLRDEHRTTSGIGGRRRAPAWMVKRIQKGPLPSLFLARRTAWIRSTNTRTFVTTGTGEIEYDSEREGIVELVEDNDDQDRFPDTVRFDWLQGDSQVFPGWDQNNDFVPDINQNDNFVRSNAVPDYERAVPPLPFRPPGIFSSGWI